jgi:hypothetical protein
MTRPKTKTQAKHHRHVRLISNANVQITRRKILMLLIHIDQAFQTILN